MNRIAFALLLSVLAFGSCVKSSDYDTPPDNSNYDPNLPVTHTIAQLKAMNGSYDFRVGGDTTLITEDVVVAGIVTADDRSGNIYKTIYVEDSTGAIQISIDAYSLYNDYPVGRKLYIRCQGLVLGYNGGTPVLGRGVGERYEVLGIAGSAIERHLITGPIGNTITPPVVSITELMASPATYRSYSNRLVTVKDVQFVDSLGNLGYAQPNGTTNRDIKDCSNKTLDVRTSNFANFFNAKLPTGNGTITGIFSVFVSSFNGSVSPQLTLRDTGDVKLTGPRCGGGTGGTVGVTLLSENFNSATSGVIALAGWTNASEAGTQKWSFSNAGSTSNPYARVSAFNSNETSVISWLVTPSINLSGASNPVLTFRSANGFDNGATMKVYATTNFTGNPATTTWTQLAATLAPSSPSGFSSFTSSGNVSLAAFATGNVWIAWKYEGEDAAGTATDKTTTWEIDDVKVVKD